MIKSIIKPFLISISLFSSQAFAMISPEDDIKAESKCGYCHIRQQGRRVVLPKPNEPVIPVCPECLVDSLPFDPNKPPPHPEDADGVDYFPSEDRWIPFKKNIQLIECGATKLIKESKGYLRHYYYNPSKSIWSWNSSPMKAANNLHGPAFDDTHHSYDKKISKTDKKSSGQYDREHKGEN